MTNQNRAFNCLYYIVPLKLYNGQQGLNSELLVYKTSALTTKL